MEKKDNVKTQGEDSPLTAKERCLDHTLPLRPVEGANSAKTFISDIQPLGLWDGNILLFKPLSLWYFITTAFAK